MNKKDVLEVKKQFTKDNCAITKICGCYVDHEKNKILKMKEAFLSLPEEEEFKYFEIFKHTLSGTLGKNLVSMEFPLEQEEEGRSQEFLLRLRNSKLEDEVLLDQFYDMIIESFDYGENFLILLIHNMYDIPGKSTSGDEMFDASDEVYQHILCSICPVKMSKAGLTYNPLTNNIEQRIRDWIVEQPINGFLFPAFEDRSTDIHKILYYSKNPEISQECLFLDVFGTAIPLSPKSQKETFQSVLEEALGDQADYETMKTIHENLVEIAEENKENPQPSVLTKPEVKRLLERSGVEQKAIDDFESVYETVVDKETEFIVSNIAETRKFNIETPDIVIKVNPDKTDLIETKIIDGKQCLVITVDDHVTVNGVSVRTITKKEGFLEHDRTSES